MVTIHRVYGLRFAILTDDREPAHVHIYGDSELKVNIVGAAGLPELVEDTGFKANDRRRAMDVMHERQAEFMTRLREIHGS